LEKCRAKYETAKAAVASKQAELNECSKEIKALEKQGAAALTQKQNASIEARTLMHKLKSWEKDFKDAQRAVKALSQAHPWIEKEKQFFGMAGSDFDFTSRDVPASMKRLQQIKTENDRISKKINKKVMGMIEKAEAEYTELSRKKEVRLPVSFSLAHFNAGSHIFFPFSTNTNNRSSSMTRPRSRPSSPSST